MDISQLRNGLAAKRGRVVSPRLAALIAGGVAGVLLLGLGVWQIAGMAAGRKAPAPVAVAALSQDELDARRGPIGAPLLWKVSGQGSTVYLFGSLHYLKSNMGWMDRRLFQAFDSSAEVWFELAEMDQPGPVDLRQPAYMAARPVLTEGLSELEKEQLTTILNRYNYTLEDMARVKPMVMAAALENLDVTAGGFDFDRGADYTLFKRARTMKKPVRGLESFRDHYAYTVYLDPARMKGDGTRALKSALAAHFGTGAVEDIHVVARYWKGGDQRALSDSLAREREADPELNAALLDERNAKWMPRLEAMIGGKGVVFVTVGTDHLLGPKGLVAMLRAKGYRVERVEP